MQKLTAVVTGGTRGIGLGIAEALVNRGALVAVTFHNDDDAAAAAKLRLETAAADSSQVLVFNCSNANPEAIGRTYRQVLEKFGSLNVLVNNAGIMNQGSLENVSVEEWNRTLQINLSGAFYWCSRVVPTMKVAGFGRIINISSVAARGGGVIGPHYAASKAGLLGLTCYAARELGAYGITVNAIAPAFIEDAGIFAHWSAAQLENVKKKLLVPRIGNVRDVTRAFEYLLDSDFVNGVCMDVNGGSFMI